ncbi:MAG: hypothetical protein J7J57_00420 [Caldisericaceae bacterium]|nr:hypothetical protein [Caldisericaceae bacterium]
MFLWIVIAVWFICGIISNIIVKEENLSSGYRFLLFLEGFIGLFFLFIFKDKKNEKK